MKKIIYKNVHPASYTPKKAKYLLTDSFLRLALKNSFGLPGSLINHIYIWYQ
jgi:hypothetical protein